jgi:hypothetical protein
LEGLSLRPGQRASRGSTSPLHAAPTLNRKR